MKKLIYLVSLFVLVQACKKSSDTDPTYSVDTTAESAQQIGDLSASIDEAGGNANGSITISSMDVEFAKKTYARLSGEKLNTAKISTLFIPEAQAAACSTTTFDACGTAGTGKRVREFAGCTIGTAGAITGNVTLTFSNPLCKITGNPQSVSRVPNFTITGLRGATFTVGAPTTGQTLTRAVAGSTYDFSNAGVRRTFVTPKGNTLLDITTTTGTPLTITNGDLRTNRTINSGTLVITNNLTSESCTLTPNTVAWTGGCNCPTSGFWQGTCTGGKTFRVTYGTTCGSVTVENTGETTQTVSLDRCGS